MNANITKGDLCIVVKARSCCGNTDGIGMIVTAQSEPRGFWINCPSCQARHYEVAVVIGGNQTLRGKSMPLVGEVARLRRIPPIDEPTAIDVADRAPA